MIERIANLTEKALRYSIPGIWIYIQKIGYSSKSNSKIEFDTNELSACLLIGVIIYIFYRTHLKIHA